MPPRADGLDGIGKMTFVGASTGRAESTTNAATRFDTVAADPL